MILLKRVIVAVIFIPLILVASFSGGYALLGLLTLFTLIGLYEMREMFRQKYDLIPFIVIPLGVIFLWLSSLLDMQMVAISFLILLLFVTGYDIFFNRIEGSVMRIALSCLAIVYQPVLYSLVYRLSELDNGGHLVVSLIIVVWITDTFAYFLGMLLGKHRGVIKASPRKSVEGFIFGIIFAFIGAYIIRITFMEELSMKIMILAAISAGIFGQFGDLLESIFKRDVGVKDSSRIIPGHGGILDRFDSFIIAAPVFYILYLIFV